MGERDHHLASRGGLRRFVFRPARVARKAKCLGRHPMADRRSMVSPGGACRRLRTRRRRRNLACARQREAYREFARRNDQHRGADARRQGRPAHSCATAARTRTARRAAEPGGRPSRGHQRRAGRPRRPTLDHRAALRPGLLGAGRERSVHPDRTRGGRASRMDRRAPGAHALGNRRARSRPGRRRGRLGNARRAGLGRASSADGSACPDRRSGLVTASGRRA